MLTSALTSQCVAFVFIDLKKTGLTPFVHDTGMTPFVHTRRTAGICISLKIMNLECRKLTDLISV